MMTSNVGALVSNFPDVPLWVMFNPKPVNCIYPFKCSDVDNFLIFMSCIGQVKIEDPILREQLQKIHFREFIDYNRMLYTIY